MRAAMVTGPKQIDVVNFDTPLSDGKKVIIKITHSGICGSDIHAWKKGTGFGDIKNFIPGHELAGQVVDPGIRKDIKVGDLVTVIPFNNCGECPTCRKGSPAMCLKFLQGDPEYMCPGVNAPGAYAEFLAARPDMVRKLPEGMSPEEGAMIEPASVGCHAVRCAGIRPGDSVLVSGGGIIGLLCAAWARINGAGYIALTEANDLRGKNALEMGDVDEYYDVKDPDYLPKMIEASKGGFDFALEASATDAGINSSFQALKAFGTFALVGYTEKPSSIMTILEMIKEIEHKTIFGYKIEEFEMTMNLMARKSLNTKKFVSGTCDLNGVQAAMERLSSGTNPDVKIIIRP